MEIDNEPLESTSKMHDPHARLIRYVEEKPRLQKRVDELESREKLDDDGKKELESIKSRLRTLANTKREILDEIIFPSMANLTFFFQAVSEFNELDFESEIIDLLGIKRLNPRKSHYAFMFEDLVANMLSLGSRNYDYRLKLIPILERLIWLKVTGMEILNTQESSLKVIGEIGKPIVWTEMLGARVKDVYDFEILTKGIKNTKKKKYAYGGSEEEREAAFNEEAKKNSPKRTFLDIDAKTRVNSFLSSS